MQERLQEQQTRFRRRNTFLDAALGLLSAAQRVEPLLEALLVSAAEGATPASEGVTPGSESDATRDQLFVYALLGAVSLARRIQAHAEAARALPSTAPGPAALRQPAPERPSLLRELAR